LRAKAGLRPGLSLQRATDLLLLFVGADVYHVLVGVDGWSHEEWTDWAVSTAAEQIFGRSRSEPGFPIRGGRFSSASRRRDHDATRSEERRVGKEWRCRGARGQVRKG